MKHLETWPALTGMLLSVSLLAGTTPLAAQPDEVPDTKLVQINLLAAGKAGSNELSDLPANTRKAIEDIRDFLPFKSYRLLDTSLVRVVVPSHQGISRAPARTYMRGPEDSTLEVTIALTADEQGSEVFVHRFEVSPSVMDRLRAVTVTPERQQKADTGEPVVAPRADLIDSGSLISTSFTAAVGQTVVVGSSRLNGGDDALIVLFTALP